MDDLRTETTNKDEKPTVTNKGIYDGLPPKGTTLRDQLKMLFMSDESARQIALGTAIGVFLAFSPFIGIHTVAAIGIALILRASRLAAFLATLINNPVTMTFIYLFEMKLGSYLLGFSLVLPENLWTNLMELFSIGRMAFLSIMAGFLITGLLSSVVAYFITLGVVLLIENKRTRFRQP